MGISSREPSATPQAPSALVKASKMAAEKVFADMDENVVRFQLAAQETIRPEDLEAMEAGDWDLTLFTCNVGGKSRVTVRFARQTND